MSPSDPAATIDLAEVDLLDPAWFADGPPHELFARMRAEAPVRWNKLARRRRLLVAHAPRRVTAVSKDTETFSSHRAGIFLNPDQVTPLDLNRNLLLYKDPPEHTKYRKILQRRSPLTRARARGLGAGADSARHRCATDKGEFDFVADIAVPVPLGVLAELMGLPEEDIPQMYELTERIEEAQRLPTVGGAGHVRRAGRVPAGADRRQTGRGDESLVTRLREAEVDGERLTDPEILVFFGLLVFAGNDTSRNTASGGCSPCSRTPTSAALREDPALIPTRSRRSCATLGRQLLRAARPRATPRSAARRSPRTTR